MNFSRKRYRQHALRVKKDLRTLNIEDISFCVENKTYINYSLFQYYHGVRLTNYIAWWESGESIKVKVDEKTTPIAITCQWCQITFYGYRFITYFCFRFWIMNVIWFFVLFLSCIDLGCTDMHNGFRICSNFHRACSHLIFPSQNVNIKKEYCNATSLSPFCIQILAQYFLWFINALFFLRFLSIITDIGS